jgi:hypothetical protein
MQRHPLAIDLAAALLVCITAGAVTYAAAGAVLDQMLLRFAAAAQTPMAFEVASIKPNVTWNQPGSGLAAPQPGGRYRGVGLTVRRLIGDAVEVMVMDSVEPPTAD